VEGESQLSSNKNEFGLQRGNKSAMRFWVRAGASRVHRNLQLVSSCKAEPQLAFHDKGIHVQVSGLEHFPDKISGAVRR